jgi:hypothetical protein
MTVDEARRFLRNVRLSATKGRSITMALLAARCGYSREHLHRVAMNGRITAKLAEQVGRVFQDVINGKDQVPFPPSYDCDPRPRGGARPAVRHDDARLRSARQFRGKSSGDAASLLPSGVETDDALSRGPCSGGGNTQTRPHGAGHPNKKTATVEPNASKQASERRPTIPPVIHLEVHTLLMKLLK